MSKLWLADGTQRLMPPLHDLWQHKRMFVRRRYFAGIVVVE
jgi:hypothetical protein